jgi:glycosyltransferase involved in cell wall biosynthesis
MADFQEPGGHEPPLQRLDGGREATDMPRLSLAVVMTHPTQFDGPLFSLISQAGLIDLTVYYLLTDRIADAVDHELGFSPNWDIPVAKGYRYVCCPQGFLRTFLFLHRECVSSHKFDLVILPGYSRLGVTLLALVRNGQPLGMRLDTVPIYPERAWKARCKQKLLPTLFRRFATFHPVGSLSEGYLKGLGVAPSKMFRFPYATDNAYLADRAKRFGQDRERWLLEVGIPANTFVVLGVLKFVPRENPMELLRGFRLFNEKFPQSVLILVGAGGLQREMEAYIAASNLGACTRLVGYAKYSELPKWYAISNVFVHSAARECWGVSVNEAMACGLPVVASSSVGSSYDLIQGGLNGYQYPAGDVQVLADCLGNIASRPDRGRQLGERSQSLIKAWDFEATLKSLESAVTKVRGESPCRGSR